MNINKTNSKLDVKVKLQALWLFAILNYLYCDILGLMDVNLLTQFLTGTVEGMQMTPEFLLGAAILMEIPIAMVLLSRILDYKANRYTNIIAASIMTLVQVATLFIGTATMYYIFFSIIEITATSYIIITAIKWNKPEEN